MKEYLVNFMIKLLGVILKMISPDLKDLIKKNLLEWEVKAKATKNPFDDILVEFLKIIFG